MDAASIIDKTVADNRQDYTLPLKIRSAGT